MRIRTMAITILAAGLTAFVWAGQDPVERPQESMKHQHGQMHQHMQGNKMDPGMMQNMMPRMMNQHKEILGLVEKLEQDLKQLQQEKKLKAVKKSLAEDLALVADLRSKLEQRSSMMEQMKQHMEQCPMMQSKEHHQPNH